MSKIELKSVIRPFLLVIQLVIANDARSQNWADSMSHKDRFWSNSGGFARELALGAGGFGMLADTGLRTLAVNPFSVDPLFMLQNPAYASHYPGYLWFDAGGTNGSQDGGFGQSFGGTFSVGDDHSLTMGLFLARPDAVGFSLIDPNIFPAITSLSRTLTFAEPTNTWEALASYHLGAIDAGVGVAYVSTSQGSTGSPSVDSTAHKSDFHQLGITAGVLADFGNNLLFDVGGSLLLPKLSVSSAFAGTSTSTGDLSVSALGINTRLFIPLRTEFYLVPFANLYTESGSSTILATPKDLPSSTNYDAGLGVNFWQSGVHIMSGVSFSHYEQTIPAVSTINQPSLTKTQTIGPRFTIGAEWPILRWLTARLGYFASTATEERTILVSNSGVATVTIPRSDLYSPLYGVSPSGLTVGAGFKIDRLNIDVIVNDESLRRSPLDLNGFELFGFVTLGYRFD